MRRRWFALLPLLIAALPVSAAGLRAGAAKRVVTPDLKKHAPVYLAGFGNNRQATGVHDDLYARCLALAVSSRPLVLCGVDSIGLFLDDTDKVRAAVPGADVVVASLHDHQAPDTMGLWGPAPGQSGLNEDYNRFVVERISEAAQEAVANLTPARVTIASIHDAELDAFINDTRPPVVHDSTIIVLRAVEEKTKRPIGTLLNWANHPEALGSKNTLVTADYPAYLYQRAEELLGGTAVFLNGAVGGMQSPLGSIFFDAEAARPAEENTFRKAGIIGRRVAEFAATALAGAKPVRVTAIELRETDVSIPMANRGFELAAKAGVFRGRKQFQAGGATLTRAGYAVLRDGKRPLLEIALIPGELYPELSIGGIAKYEGADFPDVPLEKPIKSLFTAPHKMLVGLAYDEIGYIIPKAEWDNDAPWLNKALKRWYGEVNAVGPEAAPLLQRAIEQLIPAPARAQ